MDRKASEDGAAIVSKWLRIRAQRIKAYLDQLAKKKTKGGD